MNDSVIDKLAEITRGLGEGNLSDLNYDELNTNLTGALSEVAHYIKEIRGNLSEVKPSLEGSASTGPGDIGHLGDIDKTLSEAADTLFTLTEKAIDDNKRSSELVAKLEESLRGTNHGSSELIGRLSAINDESRGDLMDVFTALSFQDLAGQKIKKITDLISGVEVKILQVLVALGYDKDDKACRQDEVLTALKESSGPIEQDMVDDILKNFGL